MNASQSQCLKRCEFKASLPGDSKIRWSQPVLEMGYATPTGNSRKLFDLILAAERNARGGVESIRESEFVNSQSAAKSCVLIGAL